MGCAAAINTLKLARHIVRSEPSARVLIVNLELCSLHLQETSELEQLLSYLIFADGCAATLVSAEPRGLRLERFHVAQIPETPDLITWRVGDQGFDMFLSGRVPAVLRESLASVQEAVLDGASVAEIDHWAVHPGGRSILDAVAESLELPPTSLRHSRDVLREYGNMSSASVMFVLQRVLANARPGQRGCALAFGPGLTAESCLFSVPGA
jgi:alpha-pyrone synthase